MLGYAPAIRAPPPAVTNALACRSAADHVDHGTATRRAAATPPTPHPHYSRSVVQPVRAILQEERYGWALVLLGANYLLGDWLGRLSDAIFIAILLLITGHPKVPAQLRLTAYVAAVFSIALSLTRYIEATPTTIALDALSTMVVVVVTVIAVFIRLVHHTDVSASTVMGAFLGYALFGFAAAYLFIAIAAFTGDGFFTQDPRPESDYIYFSLVTLTTVGFGDITPATDLAKRLVGLEALIGQVFLVVLVSRLVSLWKAPSRLPPSPEA